MNTILNLGYLVSMALLLGYGIMLLIESHTIRKRERRLQ
ncbi:hypothetical protein MNBD_PLANCTO03-1064 [hydrothermal vent metagenome]|uniref:Uncharacterized protein n=1 Tax=hydrothermal vent metagenome TaxID=652676 RepID=A0A3B1E844_9ZZZZ